MEEKIFTIFWLTAEYQFVKGYDIASAMNNAGIGRGALRAIDFYAEGDQSKNYEWSSDNNNWSKIE